MPTPPLLLLLPLLLRAAEDAAAAAEKRKVEEREADLREREEFEQRLKERDEVRRCLLRFARCAALCTLCHVVHAALRRAPLLHRAAQRAGGRLLRAAPLSGCRRAGGVQGPGAACLPCLPAPVMPATRPHT